MTDIKVAMTPYGRTADGSMGLLIGSDGNPDVSVMEVLASKPSVDDANNFVGRLVFEISSRNIYVWTDDPSDEWVGLQISNVTVAAPEPTAGLNPDTGELYYSTNTEILYLWDGSTWVPVGGARGASVLWRHYTGDGLTAQFSTGASTFPPTEYCQVYIDGVVQAPGANGVRDYYMVGNDVVLNTAPSVGEAVTIRTLTFITAARNSKFNTNAYTTDGTTNEYDIGTIAAKEGQIWVFVDGVHQRADWGGGAGTYDYQVNTKNTTIASISYAGGIATATTNTVHSFAIGDAITVFGATQTGFNGTHNITSVANSGGIQKIFTYAISDPGVTDATTTDSMYYSPIKENDTISFVDASGAPVPLAAGHVVSLQVAENVTVGEVIGEANAAANVGTGVGVFKDKDGEVINFKSLKAGNRITVTGSTNEITLSAQNDSVVSVASFNGVSSSTYTVQPNDHYIAVRNASGGIVSIDMDTNIPTDASMTGRTIAIKDEGGNAGTYEIRLVPNGSSSIEDGAEGSAYVMNTDREFVKLIFDGQDWHIAEQYPPAAGPAGPAGATGPAGPAGSMATMARTAIDGSTDPYVVVDTDEYLAINNTSGSALEIDLDTNFSAGDGGRVITIKDEGYNAGTHNITLQQDSGAKINNGTDGVGLVMSTNGQTVRLMWDGSNFHTLQE